MNIFSCRYLCLWSPCSHIFLFPLLRSRCDMHDNPPSPAGTQKTTWLTLRDRTVPVVPPENIGTWPQQLWRLTSMIWPYLMLKYVLSSNLIIGGYCMKTIVMASGTYTCLCHQVHIHVYVIRYIYMFMASGTYTCLCSSHQGTNTCNFKTPDVHLDVLLQWDWMTLNYIFPQSVSIGGICL